MACEGLVRHIQLEDQLRIRFPGQPEPFDVGVEVGMVAALMAEGRPSFSRWISETACAQLRQLAVSFGYRLEDRAHVDTAVEVAFISTAIRPRLSVVR